MTDAALDFHKLMNVRAATKVSRRLILHCGVVVAQNRAGPTCRILAVGLMSILNRRATNYRKKELASHAPLAFSKDLQAEGWHSG